MEKPRPYYRQFILASLLGVAVLESLKAASGRLRFGFATFYCLAGVQYMRISIQVQNSSMLKAPRCGCGQMYRLLSPQKSRLTQKSNPSLLLGASTATSTHSWLLFSAQNRKNTSRQRNNDNHKRHHGIQRVRETRFWRQHYCGFCCCRWTGVKVFFGN